MKSVKPEYVLFGVGIVMWCVIYAIIGPAPLGDDFFQFKDPAINLATGRGFTMVSDPGHPSIQPVLYSAYPPLYALLYSAFISVFGIGTYANTYFEFFIQVIRSLLLMEVLVGTLMRKASMWLRILVTLAIIYMLPLTPENDRPEDLVLILFLLSVLALLKIKGNQKIFWAYAIAGVALTVSPFGGLLNLAYVFAAHVYEKCRDGFQLESVKSEWKPMLGAAIVPGIALASYFAVDGTEFIERFLKLGQDKHNLSFVLATENPYMLALSRLWTGMMMYIAIIGLVSAWSLWQGVMNSSERTNWWLIATLFFAISLTTLVVFPNKCYYLYLVSLVTIVMFAYFSYRLHAKQHYAVLLLALIFVIPISRQNVVKMVYTRYKNIKAYETAMAQSRKLYESFIKNKDAYIGLAMKPENPYFFLKSVHPKICVVNNLQEDEIEKLDYIALGYISNVCGERVTNPPKTLDMKDYELLYAVDGTLESVGSYEAKFIRDNESWGYEMYKRK